MWLLLGIVAGFILGLKMGIPIGHRAERRQMRLAAARGARADRDLPPGKR